MKKTVKRRSVIAMENRQSFSVNMKKESIAKIDKLAGKLGISRSRFVEVSVESALSLDSILISIITFGLGTKSLQQVKDDIDSMGSPVVQEGF